MKQYQNLAPSQKKGKCDDLQNTDSSLLYKNCQNDSPSKIDYKKFKRQSHNTELQFPAKKIHTNDDDRTTTTGTLGFDQSQASDPAGRPTNGRRKPCIEELFENSSNSLNFQNFHNQEQFSENFDSESQNPNNLSMTTPLGPMVKFIPNLIFGQDPPTTNLPKNSEPRNPFFSAEKFQTQISDQKIFFS